ncbi:hypothetical protein [Mucilaginibacter sp. CSA2-8R]|uniref:hypothetical protein n=1 Tax=Mucilaginibacter sp. CSA2-8R TaxID=3141542 RepID=UPI00315C6BDE
MLPKLTGHHLQMFSFFKSLIGSFSRSAAIPQSGSNATVQQYLSGLQQAYAQNNGQALWHHFEQIKQGAAPANLKKLRQLYNDVPDALLSLLSYADGTYHREYAGEKIAFYLLGSDVEEYPYYLLSSGQIRQVNRFPSVFGTM